MDGGEWLAHGIYSGFCCPPVCSTHDGIPVTADEDLRFWDGADPCVHVVRLYEDLSVKAAVEDYQRDMWRSNEGGESVQRGGRA